MAEPTPPQIDRVIVAMQNADKMAAYVNSIMLDDTLIEGDRYRVRFSKKSEWGDEDGQ